MAPWLSLSVAVLAAALTVVLACAAPALAASRWTDISDAQWVNTYGVTAAQVATVAQGYDNGTFGPKDPVLRGQFIKMVMSAFGVPRPAPNTQTFSDVSSADWFYAWIEGAVAAGLTDGEPGAEFRPKDPATREEASQPLAALLARKALEVQGGISGRLGMYSSLSDYYSAEAPQLLAGFADEQSLSPRYAPSEAYLVLLGVVRGGGSSGAVELDPDTHLTRAQAVALILRAQKYLPKPGPPSVKAVAPAFGPESGGTPVIVTGTGFSQASAVLFGSVRLAPGDFQARSDTEIDIAAAPPGTGSVDVTVENPLGSSEINGHDLYTYTAASPDPGDEVVQAALKYLNVPYVWGGSDQNGFDCSGLALSVYAELGISLPHHAADQYPLGTPVALPQLRPGDLVFFGSPINHVGIYVGDGNMIDAPHTGSWVRLESMAWSDYVGACRVLPATLPVEQPRTDAVREETDLALVYSGHWNAGFSTSASGGSFAYADSEGASVTVNFTGTSLSWIGKRSPLYGIASVSVDDQAPVLVDLYGPDTAWQQVLWQTGDLPDGPHTVTISWTGTKSSLATDANIGIDALEIRGALD